MNFVPAEVKAILFALGCVGEAELKVAVEHVKRNTACFGITEVRQAIAYVRSNYPILFDDSRAEPSFHLWSSPIPGALPATTAVTAANPTSAIPGPASPVPLAVAATAAAAVTTMPAAVQPSVRQEAGTDVLAAADSLGEQVFETNPATIPALLAVAGTLPSAATEPETLQPPTPAAATPPAASQATPGPDSDLSPEPEL